MPAQTGQWPGDHLYFFLSPTTDIRLHRFMPFKCELLAWQDVYRFHLTPVGDQIMRRLASHIMYQDTHT